MILIRLFRLVIGPTYKQKLINSILKKKLKIHNIFLKYESYKKYINLRNMIHFLRSTAVVLRILGKTIKKICYIRKQNYL